MNKQYFLNKTELETVEMLYKIEKEGDMDKLKNTIFTREGLRVIHIYIELLFNQNLIIMVPEKFEYFARALASEKYDIVKFYNMFMKQENDSTNSLLIIEKKEYNKYKHFIQPPQYGALFNSENIRRINPHREIPTEEYYEKYSLSKSMFDFRIGG